MIGVRPDLDAFALREIGSLAIRAHVERHDDRARSGRQQNVVFRDRADAGMNDLQLHAVVGKLRQHLAQHFDRALHVRLDHERQFLDFSRAEAVRATGRA